ncbi:tRNA uridine 5-carboxymethylaminomethyl modification enzyme MnmG [Planctomycetota bacterium]|nr:tRNA uridine 5-carboxymethylaminomethyl modification enzyme MnmG [Planctomycetota bacterium]
MVGARFPFLAIRMESVMPADVFDVVVVGAGHAGIEAAAAAARLGCRTALVSGNLDTIGKMSCNPSIGGTAKGQLAREIDALGGWMGLATDATGIQFRTLNRSKGPAMWSPRAQCDKLAYHRWMKQRTETTANLFPVQGEAWEVVTASGAVAGLRLRDGRLLTTTRLVITTGTFLRGLMHQGETRTDGGRMGDLGSGRVGDPAVQGISGQLLGLGLRLIRHKTGTPCRLLGRTVRIDRCEIQPGDEPPIPFSFLTPAITQPQVPCWACRTTPEAHALIKANLHRAPMYNGQINSIGPRYCPSIEDKVVRFADRDSHHLFIEPEGRDTDEVYVSGLSTSLPIDVQAGVLAAIPALAEAHVLRWAYAVEYDVVAGDQIDHTLMVRSVPGLHLAGQINGTSGYEEAAAQGLMAGANAALSLAGKPPFILSRADGYIGVLIDDLVGRCPEEPYRMFTSRAEHRLHLRSDNADRRLTPLAATCGLVEPDRGAAVAAKQAAVTALLAAIPPAAASRIAGEGQELAAALATAPLLAAAEPAIAESAWIELRYSAYLERQESRIAQLAHHRDLPLPEDLDYRSLTMLSTEARNRLAERRPRTLGEVRALAGVREADLESLYAILQSRRWRDGATTAG